MTMKEIEPEKVGLSGNETSLVEKEKTKMRERRRRSTTTNIFHGLRKHGGYRLSARADINEVLRHLAREAGWIVEPDGTTYRASSSTTTVATMSHVTNPCLMCDGGSKSTTLMPTSSCLGGPGGCSTTTSPRRTTTVDSDAKIQSSDGGGLVSTPSAISSCQYDVALMNTYMPQNSGP